MLHQTVSVRAMKEHENSRDRGTCPSYAYGVLCNNDIEHGHRNGILCSLFLSALQPIVSLSHTTTPVEQPLGGLVQMRDTHTHPFRMDTTLIVTDTIHLKSWWNFCIAIFFSQHEVERYDIFGRALYHRMKEHAENNTTPRIILMSVDAYTDFLEHNHGMTHKNFVFQRIVFDDVPSVDDIDLSAPAHAHFMWFLRHADTCDVFGVPRLPNIGNVSSHTLSLTNPRPDQKSIEFVDNQDPLSVSCDPRFICASDLPLMLQNIFINGCPIEAPDDEIIQVYAASEIMDIATSPLYRDIQYYHARGGHMLQESTQCLQRISDARTRIDGIQQRLCEPQCCITMETIKVKGICPFCFTGFDYTALMEQILVWNSRCPICRHVLLPRDILITSAPRHSIDHGNDIHDIITRTMNDILNDDDEVRLVIFGAFGMLTEWHGRSVSDTVESIVGKARYTVLQGTRKTMRKRLTAFKKTTSRAHVLLMDVNKMSSNVNMPFVTHAIALGDNTTCALMEKAIQAFQKKGRIQELNLIDMRFA